MRHLGTYYDLNFINVFILLGARLNCLKHTMLTSTGSWTITLSYLLLKIKAPLPPRQYSRIHLQLTTNSLSFIFMPDIQNRINLPVF